MLFRLVRSALVGLGLAVLATILYGAGLWAYLRFVWAPAHHGIGAVAGVFNPVLLIVAFVLGFAWAWRRSRGRQHPSKPKAGSPGLDSYEA